MPVIPAPGTGTELGGLIAGKWLNDNKGHSEFQLWPPCVCLHTSTPPPHRQTQYIMWVIKWSDISKV